MSSVAGSAGGVHFDEQALKRGVTSVRHPLTRALLALTFIPGSSMPSATSLSAACSRPT
jgi:hypothetical protein